MLPLVHLSFHASACSLSTLHFLKILENSLEVLNVLKSSLEVVKLVIDKYQDEIPKGFDLILWGDLTTMFHPNKEDDFWKSQEKWNIMSWKLHKSSGVHTLKTDTEMVIHMLVEKKYPLMKKGDVMKMLELKIEVNDDSTMAPW
ncbi:hypothetical protein Tco_0167295 [Tanacetum coccineum]